MKKKIIAILLVLMLFTFVCVPAYAGSSSHQFIYDKTGSLDTQQRQYLNKLASDIYDTYSVPVYFYLAESLDGKDIGEFTVEKYNDIAINDDGIIVVYYEKGNALHSHYSGLSAEKFPTGYDVADPFSRTADIYSGIEACLWTAEKEIMRHDSDTSDGVIPDERLLDLLVDDADILSKSEEEDLITHLNSISNDLGIDVAVVTVNSLGGKSATAFADDFYDYNGYGQGPGADGILLLIAMQDREWAMSTTGEAIYAFTDYGLEYMEDSFIDYLSDGDYVTAFNTYAGLCEQLYTLHQQGKTFDVYSSSAHEIVYKKHLTTPMVIGSLAIGWIIAFIIVTSMRSKLKSVRPQKSAENYIREGSMHLTKKRDTFLYSTVTKTARPKQTSSGGSSTHIGSSGRSHGGSSGRF